MCLSVFYLTFQNHMNKKFLLGFIFWLFTFWSSASAWDQSVAYAYPFYVWIYSDNVRANSFQGRSYSIGFRTSVDSVNATRYWWDLTYTTDWYYLNSGYPYSFVWANRNVNLRICFWGGRLRMIRTFASNPANILNIVSTAWTCWTYTNYYPVNVTHTARADAPDYVIEKYPPWYHVGLAEWDQLSNANKVNNWARMPDVSKHIKYSYDWTWNILTFYVYDTVFSEIDPKNYWAFYNTTNFFFLNAFSWLNTVYYNDWETSFEYSQLDNLDSFWSTNVSDYLILQYMPDVCDTTCPISQSYPVHWSVIFHKRSDTEVDFVINNCSIIWDVYSIWENCATVETWVISYPEFEEELLIWWQWWFMTLRSYSAGIMTLTNQLFTVALDYDVDDPDFDLNSVYPVLDWWDWDWDWDIGWDLEYTYSDIWQYTTPNYASDECWKLNRNFNTKNTYYNQYSRYVFDDSFFWSVHGRPNWTYLTYFDTSQNHLLYESKALSSYSWYELSYSSGDLVNLDFVWAKYSVNYYWKLGETDQKFWIWKIDSIDFMFDWNKVNIWRYWDNVKDMWYTYFDMIWYSWSSLAWDLEDLIFDDQTIRYNWVCRNWVYELRDDLSSDVNYFSGADLSYSRQKSMLMTYYHSTWDFYYWVFVPFLEFPTLSWDEIVNYYRASNFWFFAFNQAEVVQDYVEDLASSLRVDFSDITCDSNWDWSVSIIEISLCPVTLIWQLFNTAAEWVNNIWETLRILWNWGNIWDPETLWEWTPSWIVWSIDWIFDFSWNRVAMLMKRLIRTLFFFLIIFILFL